MGGCGLQMAPSTPPLFPLSTCSEHGARAPASPYAHGLLRHCSGSTLLRYVLFYSSSLSALGKGAVNRAAPLTAAFLCRVSPLALGKGFAKCPINGPRQRASLPLNIFPRALCRGQRSAKPLPRAFGPLPSALGPRQRGRLQ